MNHRENNRNPILETDIQVSEEDLLTSYSLKNVPCFPINGQFKDSFEYYQILFQLFRANFLFPLSDQLVNAIKDEESILNKLPTQNDPKLAQSYHPFDQDEDDDADDSEGNDNKAEQNEYYTFDMYENYSVVKMSKKKKNISVEVQRKVSEFAELSGHDKQQIKYKDLVLLFDPETKTIFKGIITFADQNNLEGEKEEKESKYQKSIKPPQQRLVYQNAIIQFENDEIFSLNDFSTLRLIRSRQYWFSIDSCFKALMHASRIGSIAFSDQTLNGNPATNFPNYSKIEKKSYKEAVFREVDQLSRPNEAQKKAIIHAMTTESALIQGPPGTGKSFVAFEIRKLLLKLYYPKSKKPILLITKKNITLDQQIEQDLNQRHKVIRMGNQYSEKVEEVAFENLFNEEQQQSEEGFEKEKLNDNDDSNSNFASETQEVDIYSRILTDEEIRKAKLEGKAKQIQTPSVKIIQNSVQAFEDLSKLFPIKIKEPKIKKKVHQSGQTQQADISTPVASEKADSESDGFTLPRRLTKEQKDIQQRANFLKKFQIIGLTFSGCHLSYEIIQEIKPEILIIEEASEIIEAELAPLLGPWVKHIIQIGDFKQLRPFINYQELSFKKNYQISYFERLITKHNAPSVTLTHQRRMHPNFSIYSRQFYDEYSDHPSVERLRYFKEFNPSGAYFFHHTYPEEVGSIGEIFNEFEARFIEKVVYNILNNQYKNEKGDNISITVLTMYSAQFELISRLLWQQIHQKCNRLRVQTVDSFQGQESDFVLLSCVRSNPNNSNRFVLEENRINVAMSRARLGMVVIGNLVMLRQKSQRWDYIIQQAYKKKSYFSQMEQMPERFKKYGNVIPHQLKNKFNTICIYCKSNSHLGKC